MVRLVEMYSQRLTEVRFGDVTKMLNHTLFEFSLGLAHIKKVTVGASDAVNKVTAVTSNINAALRFFTSSW